MVQYSENNWQWKQNPKWHDNVIFSHSESLGKAPKSRREEKTKTAVKSCLLCMSLCIAIMNSSNHGYLDIHTAHVIYNYGHKFRDVFFMLHTYKEQLALSSCWRGSFKHVIHVLMHSLISKFIWAALIVLNESLHIKMAWNWEGVH